MHDYRRQVENLHEGFNAPDSRTEAAEILSGIIERINATPWGGPNFSHPVNPLYF